MNGPLLGEISDAIIVGGGPAGLSAALLLALQLHTVVIFDSKQYRNSAVQHMRMVPTWDNRDPENWRASTRMELSAYKTIKLMEKEIVDLRERGNNTFAATDSDGTVWLSSKVVIASGVRDIFPDLEGYKEGWTKTIFHCLYTFGFTHHGSQSCGILCIGFLTQARMALHMAHISARLCTTVTFYTNGDEKLARDIKAILPASSILRCETRKIVRLSGTDVTESAPIIHFDDGSQAVEDFLTHIPDTKVNDQWLHGLNLQKNFMGNIQIKPPFNETSVRGLFAAGDCETPHKVIDMAIASGSLTGSGVAAQLQEDKMGIDSCF